MRRRALLWVLLVSALNYQAINANRERLARSAESQRISEIARTANQLQAQQPGLSRSEALRVAEIMVSRGDA